MLKYTRSALGLLSNQYRSVLHKCALINLGIFALAIPANAETITVDLTPTLGDNAAYSWGTSGNVSGLDSFTTGYSINTETGEVTESKQSLNLSITSYSGEPSDSGGFVRGSLSYAYDNIKGITVTLSGGQNNVGMTGTDIETGDVTTKRYNYSGSAGIYPVGDETKNINAYITGFHDPASATDSSGIIMIDKKEVNSVTGAFVGNLGWRGIYVTGNNGSASVNSITADFISNRLTTSDGDEGYGRGAAIELFNNVTVGKITGDFILNHAQSRNESTLQANGSAIFISSYSKVTEQISGNFVRNTFLQGATPAVPDYYNGGGAIFNVGSVKSITGNFIENSAYRDSSVGSNVYVDGGAIYNRRTITDIDGTFIGNTADGRGGAIFNEDSSSTIDSISGNFVRNQAIAFDKQKGGGAIFNDGTITTITGNFIENSAIKSSTLESNKTDADGGAILNWGDIDTIDGTFIGNKATSTSSNGGAIVNHEVAHIKTINGTFSKNETYGAGGAIENRGEGAIIDTIDAVFTGNIAGSGGAVYNGEGTEKIGAISGTFTDNNANQGGAIFNFGTIDSVAGTYKNNSATKKSNNLARGGAIHNIGSIGDITGDFTGNYASGNSSQGGAINNQGSNAQVGNISANFTDNYAFSENSTVFGGAIQNEGRFTTSNITGNFTGNYAKSGNGNAYGGAISAPGGFGNITGDFTNNYASGVNAYGGAIYVGYDPIASISGNFIGNYVNGDNAEGGAIYNNAQISSISGTFEGNESEITGGAIVNKSHIEIIDADFTDNQSGVEGGAITNDGTIDVVEGSFTNNVTQSLGGAVYNSGTINELTAEFRGNKAGNGGAIANESGNIYIVNSSFFDNVATVRGGAIWTENDTYLVAKDNYQSIFQGNYSESIEDYNALYIGGHQSTLTFETQTGGQFYMYDSIYGSDKYNLNITGDNSGTFHLYNDVVNGDVNVESTILEIGAYGIDTNSINFAADSTLALNIDTINDYGHITSGAIDIAEGATLKAYINDAIRLRPYTDYELTILSSDTEFKNNFSDTISNERYTFTKKEGDEGVYILTWKPTGEEITHEWGGTPTNVEAAKAWMDNGPTGTISDQLWASVGNNDKKLLEDLTALAPNDAPMVQGVMIEINDRLFKAVNTHLLNDSLGKRNSAPNPNMASGDAYGLGASLWVDGYFGKSELDDRDGVHYGFDTDSKGIIVGLDYQFDPLIKAGIGYQHDSTDVDAFKREADVDTNTVFAYAEYKPNPWYANFTISYNMAEFDEEKHPFGETYKAKYDVNDLAMQAMTGYEIITPGLDITPQAGVRYHHLERDSYKDTMGQKVSSEDMDILTAVGGIKIAKDFALENCNKFRPEAYVGVTYDLVSDRDNASVTIPNGVIYNVHGKRLPRFGVEAGVGMTAEITDNLSIHANYYGGFRSDYQNHTGMVGLKYAF